MKKPLKFPHHFFVLPVYLKKKKRRRVRDWQTTRNTECSRKSNFPIFSQSSKIESNKFLLYKRIVNFLHIGKILLLDFSVYRFSDLKINKAEMALHSNRRTDLRLSV